MFLYLKGLGKYRKSKAYGLVGCLALVSMIGLAAPDLPVIGGGVVAADVIQGGNDIKDVNVHSKSAEGVAMTYTTYDSGTSGKQTASGSGVFVAPNVMVTVAHNYYDKNQEDKSAVLRGGASARSYVVMNSETEKHNKVPTSGVSETLEKDSIHLYDEKNFGKDYSNDLAVVVTKKTVEAMTGGEDSPRELSHKEVSTGDKISMVGYPNDFSTPNLSAENKARLKDGKAYSVTTTVSSVNKESGTVTYHSSALGGFSGAPLFNDKGEVVGIHQHGTNTPNAQESERIGGGTLFTEKHRAWIRSMIDKYGIKGWYIDGANRYYYDENHRALKDVESEIDGALYRFDEKGRATLLEGEEKGRVLLRVEDTKGTPLISDKVVQEGSVGKEVTTVTYKVLPDGKVIENSRTVDVTPMRERVVRKGVKEVVSPDKVESLVPKDAPIREEQPALSEGFSESDALVSGEKIQGDLGILIVSSEELVPERVEVPDFVTKVTGGEKLTVEGHRNESKIKTPSKQERSSRPETTAQFTTNGTGSSSLTAVFGGKTDKILLSTVEHSVIKHNQQRGWHKINNQWYFRNSDGKERTGWMKENDAWYYFDTNGTMQTGWLEDTDGNWYYLNDNGRMEIGWFQDSSGAWYYLGSSGRMESNTWIYYKGKWYYIDALGKLLFNSVTPDGYRVNEYGEWIN